MFLQGGFLVTARVKRVHILVVLDVKCRTIQPELVCEGKPPPGERNFLFFTPQGPATPRLPFSGFRAERLDL
jgi:hypothetical protein